MPILEFEDGSLLELLEVTFVFRDDEHREIEPFCKIVDMNGNRDVIYHREPTYKKVLEALIGRIVGYYVIAHGLGAPIPSPYIIVTQMIPNSVVIGADKFADYSKIIYDRVLAPSPDPIGGYLVTTPPEFQLPLTGSPLSLDTLPTGSGVFPISGDNLQYLRSALG